MDSDTMKCHFCNSRTYEDTVKMSLWEGDRLVVIEGIPARVCERCAEQFYDDATVNRIELLRTGRFPLAEAKSVMQVGVFALPGTAAAPAGMEPT
jgi:YgiT-type zinc finger domain-containing protein